MSKPENDDELRALWQRQNEKEPMMSIENVMTLETDFGRKIKRRNTLEYMAGAPVAGYFGWLGMTGSHGFGWLSRAACFLIVAGTLSVMRTLRKRGTGTAPPAPGAPTRDHVAHYRRELTRQRDLLASVPRWYLAPLVPGMILFIVGVTLDGHAEGVSIAQLAHAVLRPIGEVIFVFAVVAFANNLAAKKLTRKIAALGDE